MSRALVTLLKKKKVAVISGGSYKQFRRQFLASLSCPKYLLPNLFLFPTNATAFYRYQGGWKNVYWLKLSEQDRRKVKQAFRDVFREMKYVPPRKVYGQVVEDRGSQITFSALGQDVVAQLGKRGLALKENWRRENTPVKLKMAKMVAKKLPHLEVRPSAFTSIDVTRHGIDKAYGVRQIENISTYPLKRWFLLVTHSSAAAMMRQRKGPAFAVSRFAARKTPCASSGRFLNPKLFSGRFCLFAIATLAQW